MAGFTYGRSLKKYCEGKEVRGERGERGERGGSRDESVGAVVLTYVSQFSNQVLCAYFTPPDEKDIAREYICIYVCTGMVSALKHSQRMNQI